MNTARSGQLVRLASGGPSPSREGNDARARPFAMPRISAVRAALVVLGGFGVLLVALVALVASPTVALAYTPPPIEGPVTDPGGVLSESDKTALNGKLRGYKAGSGYEIAVYVVPSLNGNSIEDVSYDTARAWGIGKKGADDGVLITWAPKERKVRIESGKGVGGQLTDVETFHIQRDRMNPLFKAGKNRQALEAGIDGVAAALGGHPSAPKAIGQPVTVAPRTRSPWVSFLTFAFFGGLFLVLMVLRYLRRRTRGDAGYSTGGYYYGGGSSWSSGDSGGSSWSSGDSGGGGGGGGGDYGGGGGDFGGGGSSSDY